MISIFKATRPTGKITGSLLNDKKSFRVDLLGFSLGESRYTFNLASSSVDYEGKGLSRYEIGYVSEKAAKIHKGLRRHFSGRDSNLSDYQAVFKSQCFIFKAPHELSMEQCKIVFNCVASQFPSASKDRQETST